MNWILLRSEEQLNTLKALSFSKPQLIFKHSTRCSISSMVLNRLEKSASPEEMDCYFLDLLAYRPLSNLVAEMFDVAHESPQVLLIKNGFCVYDESHHGITMEEIMEQAMTAN